MPKKYPIEYAEKEYRDYISFIKEREYQISELQEELEQAKNRRSVLCDKLLFANENGKDYIEI